jgi:acyl-CoA thioesterase-1
LTGPAADGTVSIRFLIRTSGGAAPRVGGTGGGESGMESIANLYWGLARVRKSSGALALVMSLLAGSLGGAGPLPAKAAEGQPAVAVPMSLAAAPLRLLVLGDSLSAGYGLAHDDGFESQLRAALKAKGHDVSIIDGAVSGDTSAGGRARLDWALGDGADAAIVELGANDGLRGVDPADMEANLTAILDTLAAKHIPVLVTGMYAPPNLGPDYAKAYRAVFDRLGKRPGVLYDPFFLDGVATIPDLNQADGMHPNPTGVKHIVARLLPLVEKLLSEAKSA